MTGSHWHHVVRRGTLRRVTACGARLMTVALGALMALASARAAGAQAPSGAAGNDSERVVRTFVDAFNRHDVSAMLALADTGIVWLSVTGDSVTVETRGAEALRRSMVAYFKSMPTARSTLENVTVLGAFVSARERAHWESASGPRSQAALSVYEVQAGRVRRVWYYPAVR